MKIYIYIYFIRNGEIKILRIRVYKLRVRIGYARCFSASKSFETRGHTGGGGGGTSGARVYGDACM